MAARVRSTSLIGIEAVRVDVEAQVGGAARRFSIVGLPDGALRESRERVRCAIENSGFRFPRRDVVVSLAPASLPKTGSGFDLAIALSILAADRQLDRLALRGRLVLGELALDGRVKAAPGVIAASCYAGAKYELIVPRDNAEEAALIRGSRVLPVSSLQEAVHFLNSRIAIEYAQPPDTSSGGGDGDEPCFDDVIGQLQAKSAFEIAAGGGHNIILIGPPGAGKSMLAHRLPSLMPQLSDEESVEVTKIHSVLEPSTRRLVRRRPFRAPHHTTSTAGLVGGGSVPQPGEISLAHRGVLFLDEVVEFKRDVLEALRQPMEDRSIMVSRAALRLRFPADFILVAAMNPCPCGKRGLDEGFCDCLPAVTKRYFSRLSGPILDRIDLQLWVPPVPTSELREGPAEDPTPGMRSRVMQARRMQRERFGRADRLNAHMSQKELRARCRFSEGALSKAAEAAENMKLSARGYSRLLKVSRTIADLRESAGVEKEDVATAMNYRLNRFFEE